MKVLHSICQQIWKTQQQTQNWKRTYFIPISKMGNVIKCSNYHTITFLLHTSKVILKIVQAGLQQYMKREPPAIQLGFQRGRKIRDQIPNICWIMQKTREYQKKCTSASLTRLKHLTIWITTSCGKFLKRWEYQSTLPVS